MRLAKGTPAAMRRGPNGETWLNSGSGAHPHPRFVNIDGNLLRRPDLWLDLRQGLPFPSGSVDAIYACHVIEHFYWGELAVILKEWARALRSGGGVRILVPSLALAVNAYQRGEHEWFSDFPTAFRSPGSRLVNFLFCDGQHRLAFDFAFAEEMLLAAGFSHVTQLTPRTSAFFPPDILAELEPPGGYIDTSLVVEATVAR
jgi:predicted SAM-dependent methyltransferase